MRNRNFSYHITGLVRSVCDMRNGQFLYKKRGTKNEKINKTYRNGNFVFYSTFLYEVGFTYEKSNIPI